MKKQFEGDITMEKLRNFFTRDDGNLLLSAVQKAESCTLGEIRVRIERKAGEDPMAVARKAFESLGIRDTELHNGVLFLLTVEDRTFVILGYDGINQKVPDDFWDHVRSVVLSFVPTGHLEFTYRYNIENSSLT